MLQLLKHEVSNYFANMGQTHIYNHLTNQLIKQSTISVVIICQNLDGWEAIKLWSYEAGRLWGYKAMKLEGYAATKFLSIPA